MNFRLDEDWDIKLEVLEGETGWDWRCKVCNYMTIMYIDKFLGEYLDVENYGW